MRDFLRRAFIADPNRQAKAAGRAVWILISGKEKSRDAAPAWLARRIQTYRPELLTMST